MPLETPPDPVIGQRYLLVSHIPIYVDETGTYGTDPLWHKDLVGHFRYIKRFTLAAPVVRDWPAGTKAFTMADKAGASVEFLPLPLTCSLPQNVLALPRVVSRLWSGVKASDVVHVGVTAGPIPHGWIAGPLARLLRKFLIVIVESSPWRAEKDASLRKRVRGGVNEWVAHRLCNLATVSFYTQSEYQHRYLKDPSKGYINSASWIDDEVILSPEEAALSWREKSIPQRPLRVGLFSRLVAGKGVLVLIEAMKRLEQRGVSICLDIYGNGELLEVCEEAAKCGAVSATVSVCGTLAYDASFFAAIRQYHAVVVPSLTEEQPRIVFDAFSQAVPCLASDTSGLRQCIDEGVNGRLTRAGDDVALADLLEWAARDRASLERMGINALAAARALTHRKMHSDRCAILVEKLAAFACPKT
jgi:glycosyltransferase involved in cell wall biosynthesis